MKSLICAMLPIASYCAAPLPPGVIYTKTPGPVFFLKDHSLTFPKVRVGSKGQWCVEGIAFNSETPMLLVSLKSQSPFNPRKSNVNAKLRILNSSDSPTLEVSGKLEDPPCYSCGQSWASQYFHYSSSPSTSSSSYYEVNKQLHVAFDKKKTCLFLESSTDDSNMENAEIGIELLSGWK